jgi:hypothetical protein
MEAGQGAAHQDHGCGAEGAMTEPGERAMRRLGSPGGVVTESRFDQGRRWLTEMEQLGPEAVFPGTNA